MDAEEDPTNMDAEEVEVTPKRSLTGTREDTDHLGSDMVEEATNTEEDTLGSEMVDVDMDTDYMDMVDSGMGMDMEVMVDFQVWIF